MESRVNDRPEKATLDASIHRAGDARDPDSRDEHDGGRVRAQAMHAKHAARVLRSASTAQKNNALRALSQELRGSEAVLLAANARDLDAAQQGGAAAPLLDRLRIDPQRIEGMARAVDEIIALPDPVGRISGMSQRPSGIVVGRMQVPLGVIAMIYEARPNVTIDASALCLKSGNAVVLRGGSEARHSNAMLAELVHRALERAELPAHSVVQLDALGRDAIRTLLGLVGIIDVAIPRGGEGLVRFVAEHARVPVIAHYKGVCHLFVDEGADIANAIAMVVDAKARRPAVCNALEALLVHRAIAPALLPRLSVALRKEEVEVRADAQARPLMEGSLPAQDDDFGREFLAKILAVRVVDDLDQALDHIATHGSGHSEAIATPSYANAQRWLREVDASCVLVNASTRFNDGGELGLGAELGIATSKLHAYGPMGLDELTTRKWIVYGSGEIRG
ncbi:MAG: glutamate-5-semialdehyde dehydrogenase [Polyangiales bacterium]